MVGTPVAQYSSLNRLFDLSLYLFNKSVTLALWLVLTYEQLEDRRIDDVIDSFLFLYYKKISRFHVALR